MQAKDLFRKANRSGQAGELLIYFLLEAVLLAPQALKKMPITTNTNEERKGSDGVHLKWNSELDLLEIIFAESKIWKSSSAAIEDALASILEFHSGNMKIHECNLFTTDFKLFDEELQKKINSFIDGENSTKTRVTHACLIGFDWDQYECLDDARRKEFVSQFQQRYLQWAEAAVPKLGKKLEKFPLKNLRFDFFFIPFKDVDAFRDWFQEALH
jgi:hypothetical protein